MKLTASAVLVCAVAVACAAGCGSSSPTHPQAAASASTPTLPPTLGEEKKPAATVFADMRRAMAAAQSVHVTGTEVDEFGLTSIDALLTHNGGQEQLDTKSGVVDIETVDGQNYTRASAAVLTAQNIPHASQFADKWLAVPPMKGEGVTLPFFVDDLNLPAPATVKPTVETGTVHGQQAVTLTFADGESLVISDEGKPVLMSRVHSTEAQTFENYDKPVTLTAPPNAVRLG